MLWLTWILLSCVAGRAASNSFDLYQALHPDEVFVPKLADRTRAALEDFKTRKKLPDGRVYGQSVRDYVLNGKRLSILRKDMEAMGCRFKEDVLKEPITNKPKRYQGHSLPLWVFLCPDGGVVRAKPEGDPTSPFRKGPHGSKSMRYPYNGKFESFDDEIFKVDRDGNAVPKSGAELRPQNLLREWGDDAHADLVR